MVKTGPQRAAAYEAKIDATVVGTRITARKAAMVILQNDEQANLATLYTNVRGILDAASIYPHLNVVYTGFANKLYGMQKKYGAGSNVLALEATLAKATFVARGLDAAILHDIGSLVGISI